MTEAPGKIGRERTADAGNSPLSFSLLSLEQQQNLSLHPREKEGSTGWEEGECNAMRFQSRVEKVDKKKPATHAHRVHTHTAHTPQEKNEQLFPHSLLSGSYSMTKRKPGRRNQPSSSISVSLLCFRTLLGDLYPNRRASAEFDLNGRGQKICLLFPLQLVLHIQTIQTTSFFHSHLSCICLYVWCFPSRHLGETSCWKLPSFILVTLSLTFSIVYMNVCCFFIILSIESGEWRVELSWSHNIYLASYLPSLLFSHRHHSDCIVTSKHHQREFGFSHQRIVVVVLKLLFIFHSFPFSPSLHQTKSV